MADKNVKKPKSKPAEEELDEDKMPVISMEDCEEFDPSKKKLADILNKDSEDDSDDDEELDDDIE